MSRWHRGSPDVAVTTYCLSQ